MKKLIVVLMLLALPVWAQERDSLIIPPDSLLNPPKGECKKGEVYRCYMVSCSSTAMYCPQLYEDGKLVSSSCSNQTRCTWDCSCVNKEEK